MRAGGRLLQKVVADHRRGVERVVDVAGLEQTALIGRVGPYAGIAVGLQFGTQDSALAGPGLICCNCATWPVTPVDPLNVVPDLVRDDVGLGEVAVRP